MTLVCAALCAVLLGTCVLGAHPDIHGGVKMGVPSNNCDNGHWKLEVDWDSSSNYEYTCQENEEPIPVTQSEPTTGCVPYKDLPPPLHKCMTTKIVYPETPPMGGSHRPLWPVYGTYQYVPPQRWVHSLEHAAAVFLYHPCADPESVEKLKNIATQCLRKHIITPYRELSRDQPFAIVTYGCKLLMSDVDSDIARAFVQKTAMKAPEWRVYRDGQYSLGLLQKAEVVSDHKDSEICPAALKSSEVVASDEAIDSAGVL